MSIFRRRAREEASAAEDPDTGATTEAAEGDLADEEAQDRPAQPETPKEPVYVRDGGPFDVSEVDGPGDRLDLGSLWVLGIEGMELRLEVDQEQDAVVAATAVLGESAVQLQAFAAPKSGGQWAEIRDEIAQTVVRGKGTAQVKQGPLGAELWANMPSAGPGGKPSFSPARFTGVDGPRWFLRAVFSGKAATDESAAAPLVDFVRQTVVVRGDTPMAPRELLPLAVPNAEEPAAGDDDEPSLDPFERGPEITEVR